MSEKTYIVRFTLKSSNGKRDDEFSSRRRTGSELNAVSLSPLLRLCRYIQRTIFRE